MPPVAHVLNAPPHPRVLLWFQDDTRGYRDGEPTLAQRWLDVTKERSGVYRQVSGLYEVDPSEWDAIVTDISTANRLESSGGVGRSGVSILTPQPKTAARTVPEHLFVFQVFDNPGFRAKTIDNVVDESGNNRWLVVEQIPGSTVRASEMDLDPNLQELRDELVRVSGKRERQIVVRLQPSPNANTEYPVVEVLAYGPSKSALAGRYTRMGGAATWFVPLDVEDFAPWWDAALRHWHTIDSERFPDLPGWIEHYDWLSHDEQVASDAIAAEEARFAVAQLEHEARIAELRCQVADAANGSTKSLLVGTGTELQKAVLDVLVEFGYVVRDMDQEFPDREPREDYRITEPGIEGWLVIGDATGVAKGAKANKIAAVGRYTAYYEREEHPNFRPRQWLLVNRLIAREPTSRGDAIFRDDDREELIAAAGLAIDTVALFILHRAMARGDVGDHQIRDLLRERTGELTCQDATAWLQVLLA